MAVAAIGPRGPISTLTCIACPWRVGKAVPHVAVAPPELRPAQLPEESLAVQLDGDAVPERRQHRGYLAVRHQNLVGLDRHDLALALAAGIPAGDHRATDRSGGPGRPPLGSP
eukprot:11133040-Heterocapsa_arctica.AAC.1